MTKYSSNKPVNKRVFKQIKNKQLEIKSEIVSSIEKGDCLCFDGSIIDLKQMNHEKTNYIEQRFNILGAVRSYKPCNMKRADSPMGFYAIDLQSNQKVILKPCGSGFVQSGSKYEPHQVIIDQWKERLGLEKMGTNYFICATNYIHDEWNCEEKKNLYWSLEGHTKNFKFFDYEPNDERNVYNNVKPQKIWIVIQLKEGMVHEAKNYVKTDVLKKGILLEAAKIQIFRHVVTSDNRFNNVLVQLDKSKLVCKIMSIDEERFFEKAKHNAKGKPVHEWYIKEMKRIISIHLFKKMIESNKNELILFLKEIKEKCEKEANQFGFKSFKDNVKYLKKALKSIE